MRLRFGRESREAIDLDTLESAESGERATWSARDDGTYEVATAVDETDEPAADEPAVIEPDATTADDDAGGRDPDRGVVVPRAQRRRRRGRALVILLLVIALPVAAAGVGIVWFEHRLDGSPGGRAVTVTIKPSTSTNAIADLLEKKGVIDSTLAFRLYTRVFHHSKLHAGTYTLREHMGVRAAVHALEHLAQPTRLVLSVPPGLWLSEIAVKVHDQLHLDPLEFVALVKTGADGSVRSLYQPPGTASLEGLLYPDTYYFTPRSTALDVVRTMVHRFDEVAGSIGLAHAAAAIGKSPYDAVKVAALIQGEAKFDAERPIVASAIYNRLALNMSLDIDAEVLYANNTHSTKDFARLRQIDSPYNSYRYPGLGPTPISAVSLVSLRAAVHPAHTSFLYWVNGDCAGHLVFATTQTEQDHNVAHYQQLRCG